MTKQTLRGLVRYGADYLSRRGVEDADFDARQLLLHCFGIDGTRLLTDGERAVDGADAERYHRLLERRASGEPLQYILGQWDFYDSSFFVGPGVLIPRPETEQLTELCIERIGSGNDKTVYDLCAGTGCIGLSIAKAYPQAQVYLLELHEAAFGYLQKNAAVMALPNARPVKADVLRGCPPDLPAPDLIVSNPPYVKAGELADLQREVGFEPASALDGGEDGYTFYRAIAEKWLPLLKENGFAAVECGEGQPETVAELFAPSLDCRTVTDLYGVSRFVVGDKRSN